MPAFDIKGMILSFHILDLPVYGLHAIGLQKVVGLAEMTAAEKAAGGGKRAGMGGCQDQVLRVGEHGGLALCRPAPEHIYDGAVLSVDGGDHGVGELLPALSLMRIGLVGPHGEHGVQKQDALIRPFFQITVVGNRTAKVVVKLLIDILQGGRDIPLLRLHGKAESVRLVHVMVRILSQDHHLHLAERGKMKGVENLIRRRKHHVGGVFLFYEMKKLRVVGLAEFSVDLRKPVVLYH